MKIYRSIVPRCPVHNYYRDGAMRFDENSGGATNYEPNSFDGPVEDAKYKEPPLKCSGDATRYNHRDGNDDYTQPGNLFRLMTSAQRQRLFENIARAMQGVSAKKSLLVKSAIFPKPTPPTAKASNKH